MATQPVSHGAISSSLTVTSGNELDVLNGGTVNLTNVSNGGLEVIEPGGTGKGDQVKSGGLLIVSSGATETAYGFVAPTISNFGAAIVIPGAVTSDFATISYGQIFSSGVAGISGGSLYQHATTIGIETLTGSETEFILPGGRIYDFIVSSGALVNVYSSGVFESSTLYKGATADIFVGGTARAITVSSSGALVVSSGGVASGGTIAKGGQLVIGSGGSASAATVVAGGQVVVSSGGTAYDTTVTGDLIVMSGGSIAGTTIGGFGLLDLQGLAYKAGGSASLNSATDVLTISQGGKTTTEQLSGTYAGEYFHLLDDTVGGTYVEVTNTPCFCLGTRILTTTGEVAVEALAIGDCVVTAGGACRPVKWIGRRSYAGSFLAANARVQPVRFRAGSLGGGLPRRDLLVSPEHAMFLRGVLIPARCLLNGSTVLHERGMAKVEYFHVELDSHDVILAEGAASESFLDDQSRFMFHNAHEFAALYPDASQPDGFCAPRMEQGSALEAIRRQLAMVAQEHALVA